MLYSHNLKKNPDLYIFLPILYTVWADAVLTPAEVKALQDLIQQQQWLTSAERQLLLAQIDPGSPPSANELKEWYEEIQKVVDELPSEKKRKSFRHRF